MLLEELEPGREMGREKHQQAGAPASAGVSAADPCPASLPSSPKGFAGMCGRHICTSFSCVERVESWFLLPVLQADLFSHSWMGSGAEGCLEMGTPQPRDFLLLTKGARPTLPHPDAHFILHSLRQRVEARKWGFVLHRGWEMDVVSSSGIHFQVAH